ncbi:OmpA family protein [candidate division WOR-3 bacterium]|nr:OmpA family protein [candidate division WOR-3 bacterium]
MKKDIADMKMEIEGLERILETTEPGLINVIRDDEQIEKLLGDHEQMKKHITDIKMEIEEMEGILETVLDRRITASDFLHSLNIHFAFGSDVVPDGEYPKIVEAARIIRTYYLREIVMLEGYTDEAGSATANLALSTRRAEAVKRVLIEQGIPADMIIAVGKGARGLLTERTGPGISGIENRRVVFSIIEDD